MIEISNRHFDIIINKLPRVLAMARKQRTSLTLRQCEDIRQLQLLHLQLTKKLNNKKQK
jgi:hypothetical protein